MSDFPKMQQLLVFIEVVRSGGIRAAARKMDITQPSVTRIIKELEQHIGVELLHRHHSGIALTAAGRLFYAHANTLVKGMTRAVDEVRQVFCQESDRLSFGFSSLFGLTVLPDILQELNKQYGQPKLTLREAQLSTLLPALREQVLECAIGTVTADMPLQDFNVEPVFSANFSFFTSQNNPLRHATSLEELRSAYWVLPETDMGYYHQVVTEIKGKCGHFNDAVRTDSISTILNLVTRSNYVTILARAMQNSLGLDGLLCEIPISEKLPAAQYSILWHKSLLPSQIRQSFVQLVRAISQETSW